MALNMYAVLYIQHHSEFFFIFLKLSWHVTLNSIASIGFVLDQKVQEMPQAACSRSGSGPRSSSCLLREHKKFLAAFS